MYSIVSPMGPHWKALASVATAPSDWASVAAAWSATRDEAQRPAISRRRAVKPIEWFALEAGEVEEVGEPEFLLLTAMSLR